MKTEIEKLKDVVGEISSILLSLQIPDTWKTDLKDACADAEIEISE